MISWWGGLKKGGVGRESCFHFPEKEMLSSQIDYRFSRSLQLENCINGKSIQYNIKPFFFVFVFYELATLIKTRSRYGNHKKSCFVSFVSFDPQKPYFSGLRTSSSSSSSSIFLFPSSISKSSNFLSFFSWSRAAFSFLDFMSE